MDVQTAQAWSALHSLHKIWKAPIRKQTKIKVFKACIETILLYGSESWIMNMSHSRKLNGTYTKMLRVVFNTPWWKHTTNEQLYGLLPNVTTVVKCRRLSLAGHVVRSEEPASRLLLWNPDTKRRVGRPNVTLKKLIETETGLQGLELISAMKDRKFWRSNFVRCTSSEDE